MTTERSEQSDINDTIGDDSSRESPIVMQGFMMKKKTKNGSPRKSLLRSIGLKWVIRYFILYQDGRLVYYREPSIGKEKEDGVVCENVGECVIDRAKASDLAGREDAVANSFYITAHYSAKGKVNRTLLVTNGPEDFKKWISSFQKLNAFIMLYAVCSDVGGSKSIRRDLARDMVEGLRREKREDQKSRELTATLSKDQESSLVPQDNNQDNSVDEGSQEERDGPIKSLATANVAPKTSKPLDNQQHAADHSVSPVKEEVQPTENETLQDDNDTLVSSPGIATDAENEQQRADNPEIDVTNKMPSDGVARQLFGTDESVDEKGQTELCRPSESEVDTFANVESTPTTVSNKNEEEVNDYGTRLWIHVNENVVAPVPGLSQSGTGNALSDEEEGNDEACEAQLGLAAASEESAPMSSSSEEDEIVDDIDVTEMGEETFDTAEDSKRIVSEKEEIIEEKLAPVQESQGVLETASVDGTISNQEEEGKDENDKMPVQVTRESPQSGIDTALAIEGASIATFTENDGEGDEKLLTEVTGSSETEIGANEIIDSVMDLPNGDDEDAHEEGLTQPSTSSQSDASTFVSIQEEEEVHDKQLTQMNESPQLGMKTMAAPGVVTALSNDEEEVKEGIRVVAYGDTFDEMEMALDGKKSLFGIITTSLEEFCEDEIYLKCLAQDQDQSLVAFSIEYEGKEADKPEATKYTDHIELHFQSLQTISYSQKCIKSQILRLLGAPQRNDEEGHTLKSNEGETADEQKKDKLDRQKRMSSLDQHNISLSATGKTAYKHALAHPDLTFVPDGIEVLNIVRQPLGTPYNWALFSPSKDTLQVEDAGSGGVMEMTTVLQECYNDRVLFGLLRLSFTGAQFGIRQIWCGLEWKGEDCFSVKVMRQFRECHDPMSKMIGDRSLTLSNISASEMTPELVVDRVKRSCNVTDFDVSLEAMQNAHEEEQRAIKKNYWDKLKEEEAKREREKLTKLESRKEKLSSRMEIREERRKKWSKMSATELLADLGKYEMSGWALFEAEF